MTHLREHWEGVSLAGNYTLEQSLGGDDARRVLSDFARYRRTSRGRKTSARSRRRRRPTPRSLASNPPASSPEFSRSACVRASRSSGPDRLLRCLRVSRRDPRVCPQPLASRSTGIARSPRFRPRCSSLPSCAGTGDRCPRCRPHRCRRRSDQALHRRATLRRYLVRLPRRRPPARPPLAAASHERLPEEREPRRSRGGSQPADPLDSGRNQRGPGPASPAHRRLRLSGSPRRPPSRRSRVPGPAAGARCLPSSRLQSLRRQSLRHRAGRDARVRHRPK